MLHSMVKTVVILQLCSFVHYSHSYRVDNNPYHHKEILDSRSKYTLDWIVDKESKLITFNVTVKTLGWVGLGLNRQGRMAGADIMVAGVDSKGNSYCFDMHVRKDRSLQVDAKQDWRLLSAKEEGGFTHLSFSRAFDTCDEDDYPITSDHVSLIWAYGEKDELGYHYHSRGSFSAYLLDPSVTPDIDSLVKQRNQPTFPLNSGPVQQWKLKRRYHLPSQRTTYWCSIQAGPKLTHKHHIIGYRTYLENEAARLHTHHLLVYRCKAPEGIDAKALFEPFTKYAGEECYLNENRRLPLNLCRDVVSVWGYGGKPFFLPETVGFPIGEEQNEYFLYESHHDNPDLRSDLEFETGVEFFITPKTRKRDGGILITGFDIPGSLALIPPGSRVFNLIGHCNPNCTKTMLPDKGVDVVAIGLHSHNAGRNLRLRHFRNRQELPWLINDDNYNPAFQQNRLLAKEKKILPGDQLITRCTYDNTNANGTTTVTGFGTPDEMCLAFLVIANRIPYYRCTSEYPAWKTLSLLGVHNVTWNLKRQQRVVVYPEDLAGLTLGQVSDYHLHWTEEMRNDLEKDLKYSPHIVTCPTSAAPDAETFLSSLSAELGVKAESAEGKQLQELASKAASLLLKSGLKGVQQSQRRREEQEGSSREASSSSQENYGWGWGWGHPTSEANPLIPQGTPPLGAAGLGIPLNVVYPKNAGVYTPTPSCEQNPRQDEGQENSRQKYVEISRETPQDNKEKPKENKQDGVKETNADKSTGRHQENNRGWSGESENNRDKIPEDNRKKAEETRERPGENRERPGQNRERSEQDRGRPSENREGHREDRKRPEETKGKPTETGKQKSEEIKSGPGENKEKPVENNKGWSSENSKEESGENRERTAEEIFKQRYEEIRRERLAEINRIRIARPNSKPVIIQLK